MRIAVVHDYFTQLGGAEKVAEQLYCMLPGSSLFATVALQSCMPPHLGDVPVHTSWMQNLPEIHKHYRFYFLLYPLAISSIDVSDYELVISSSSSYAKGVRTNRDSMHVCTATLQCAGCGVMRATLAARPSEWLSELCCRC